MGQLWASAIVSYVCAGRVGQLLEMVRIVYGVGKGGVVIPLHDYESEEGYHVLASVCEQFVTASTMSLSSNTTICEFLVINDQ